MSIPREALSVPMRLADDDDLVRDLRCEQLAGIEPIDISDLLELADGVIALRPGDYGKR